jgi:hypothetical protein
MIWSDAFINQLAADAEQQITRDVQCIFFRFYLPLTKGQSVYTLPSYVRSIKRVAYRNRKLDGANWEELSLMLSPATVFVSPGNANNIESQQGRPLWYAMHPTNPYDIKLFPTPSESLDNPIITAGNPYAPLDNEAHCTISCWRTIDFSDNNLVLPSYIDRRIRKSYILSKAFEAEGKGQNLTASKYYKQLYNFLIDKFRAINNSCFISKKYSIEDGMITIDGFRYPRPILPSASFERVIY